MEFDYSYGLDMGMVAFALVYYLFIFALAVTSYVLQSLGMYTIAKRRQINHPWMAWVPVVSSYLLGCISDQYQYVAKGKNTARRKVLLVLNIILWVIYIAGAVSIIQAVFNIAIGTAAGKDGMELVGNAASSIALFAGAWFALFGISIALTVFQYISLYDLYNSCDPKNSVLFLVLSIVFTVTQPFFVFACRKKELGMPPRKPAPQIPQQPQWQPPQPDSRPDPWE